jgi:ADP-heptose:LPS heptosyltransferase
MPRYPLHCVLMKLVAVFNRQHSADVGEASVRNILLVNTTAMGDTLLSTPAIRAVRRAYPDSRIVSLVHRRHHDVLRYNPHLDDFILYPGKYKGVWGLVQRLRTEHFDVVITLHANDPDVVPLVYFTGAPIRAGWAESQMSFLLTHTYRRPTDPPAHTIENRLGVLQAVGIESDGVAMEIHFGSEERLFAERFIKDFEIDLAREIVVGVHPFASRAEKAWPDRNTIELLRRLEQKPGVRPLVVGGKKHQTQAEAWRPKLPPRIPLAVGMGSINHTAALLDQCDLFITTDSGPFHVAVALRVPTIMLVGPTVPAVTGPHQDREMHVVLKANVSCPECDIKAERVSHHCMAALTPDRVMAAVKERLNALNILR